MALPAICPNPQLPSSARQPYVCVVFAADISSQNAAET